MWLLRFILIGAGYTLVFYGANEFGPISHLWALVSGVVLIFFAGFIEGWARRA